MKIQSINPFDGSVVAEYDLYELKRVNQIINDCDKAYKSWSGTSFKERAHKMRKAAQLLRNRSSELAKLMALEMGKVLKDGEAEIEKCAWVCDYYAENAEQFLADEEVETDASKSYVTHRPLGIVLAVMPWNFPFWQVFRFAVPALMAGNGGLLKHASNVSGCALEIERVFKDAAFPPSIFRTLLIESSDVESVIRNKYVRAVTLTGSTPAGKSVAAIAGNEIKKSVLELGGSDPYIILEDANLELT